MSGIIGLTHPSYLLLCETWQESITHKPGSCLPPDPGLLPLPPVSSASQTVEMKAFVSHSAYGTLYQQPELRCNIKLHRSTPFSKTIKTKKTQQSNKSFRMIIKALFKNYLNKEYLITLPQQREQTMIFMCGYPLPLDRSVQNALQS